MFHKIFDNNLVMIRKSKFALKLNKRTYMGMCILDLSKVLINEFHCNFIKNKFNNKSKLLFTVIVLCIEDVHKDFSSDKEIFD